MRTHALTATLAAVGALAAASTAPAAAPPGACHVSRTCPSNTHGYVWRGLVCADRTHRTAADALTVVWRGGKWWCHRKAVAPPAPAPVPVDPLAAFKPLVSSFVQQYLEPALQQVRADASTYTALANGPGLAALQSCATTLAATVGTPPQDATALAALAQLQAMCEDFQTAGSEIRAGVAAGDEARVDAALDRFKAGLDLRDAVLHALGL